MSSVFWDERYQQPEYAYSDDANAYFAHFPPQLRPWVHGRAAAALKPGGILILEAF